MAQHVGDDPDDVYRDASRPHLRRVLPQDALWQSALAQAARPRAGTSGCLYSHRDTYL